MLSRCCGIGSLAPQMAVVVSDLILSFFCCCFYAPGDHHRVVGARHCRSNAACHDHRRGAGSRKVSGRSRAAVPCRRWMCCDGCERVVRQALQNLRGVDRVDVNVPTEKVTVTGYVERARVMQEVRRSGKKAEFLPSGGTCFGSSGGGGYHRNSYNYKRHGYSNGDRHGRMREPARGAGHVGNMFDDDDVNAACLIM